MDSTDQLQGFQSRLRRSHFHQKAGGQYFLREISIIPSTTSACTAQSSRGALETWSESSALLVLFCSTAEPGPPTSLANCCAPPRALCAIKGKCANDGLRRGNTSPLLQIEVSMRAAQIGTRRAEPLLPHFHNNKNCSSQCTSLSTLKASAKSVWDFIVSFMFISIWTQSRMYMSNGATGNVLLMWRNEANVVGISPGSGRERVKNVQLVLTSHSTHIAPEGGAAFIRPVWTHTCTQQWKHKHTQIHICIHLQTDACTQLMHLCTHIHTHTFSERHTQTQEGEPKLAGLHSRASAEPLWLVHLSAMLCFLLKGALGVPPLAC